MYKLQPIELKVAGENSYVVRFQSDSGEVEYKFHVENTLGFDLLVSDQQFLEITNCDPAANRLKEAICNFHEARNFVYAEPKVCGTQGE